LDFPELIFDGPATAPLTLALAHGAGGPMDSPFLAAVAEGVGQRGFRVARFEFPYMRARRQDGRRGAPDSPPVLRQAWLDTIAKLGGGQKLVIGGKSMGGRIASMVADEARVRGLVCLGYPFHPPGKPERLRTAHLKNLATPALIVQGERDSFGTPEEVRGFGLPPSIRLVWIGAGDHSFKPPARSGRTQAGNIAEAIAAVAEFLLALVERSLAHDPTTNL
jgi:predicted alpha/beta-hydrolase family hydrolase